MSDPIDLLDYLAKAQIPDCVEGPWYRFQRVIALIDRYVTVDPGSHWLDVGCQIGQFLKMVQVRYNNVVTAGIDDYAPEMVVNISCRFLNVKVSDSSHVFDGTWRYYQRQIDKVGFDLDERFDFISALEVIEHMIDTDAFILECRNHLKPGGYLIVSTPNINSLRNRIQVPLGRYPSGLEYRTVVHHVRLYNLDTMRSHMASLGFKLVGISGVNFLPLRLLSQPAVRQLDLSLARLWPSLCGNLIAIFSLAD